MWVEMEPGLWGRLLEDLEVEEPKGFYSNFVAPDSPEKIIKW